MLKPLIFIFFLVFMQFASQGQSAKTESPKANTLVAQTSDMKTETVEGVWAVSSYLGQKLADELSNRMNLGETTAPVEKQPKKVTLVIGSFKIERMD